MISQLHIENFRSIEKATIDLGRITLLTGSNNSGKSSLMYGLFCLKSVVQNSNRTLDGLFNLPNIINLGGFKNVIFANDVDKAISIFATVNIKNIDFKQELTLSKNQNFSWVRIEEPINRGFCTSFVLPYTPLHTQNFRGIDSVYLKIEGVEGGLMPLFERIEYQGNEHIILSSSDLQNLYIYSYLEFIPTRRGFSQPSFGMVPLNFDIVTEDEIATKIALDKNLQEGISYYLEKIANRTFSVYIIPTTAVFFLRTKDTKTGLENDLVNEGTGTNQLVTMLAKALQPDKKFICIDEPEIHLHPSMIAKLVEALVEIAYTQDKQFMLSTHSEHFVTCLLAEVVKKNLQPDDLKVYYLTKEDQRTNIEHQAVNANGQIEGGLKNFYEAELTNLETFFKIA